MLSDVKHETAIKPGALELAQALNDVLGILKNPSDAYKQVRDEHVSLQNTKKEHAEVLAKNEQVLREHKENHVKEGVAREKHQKELDAKLKEIADQNKALSAKETSLKVRDSSLHSRDIALTEREKAVGQKEVLLNNKEASLKERELALKKGNEELQRQLDEVRATKDKLREAVG